MTFKFADEELSWQSEQENILQRARRRNVASDVKLANFNVSTLQNYWERRLFFGSELLMKEITEA